MHYILFVRMYIQCMCTTSINQTKTCQRDSCDVLNKYPHFICFQRVSCVPLPVKSHKKETLHKKIKKYLHPKSICDNYSSIYIHQWDRSVLRDTEPVIRSVVSKTAFRKKIRVSTAWKRLSELVEIIWLTSGKVWTISGLPHFRNHHAGVYAYVCDEYVVSVLPQTSTGHIILL